MKKDEMEENNTLINLPVDVLELIMKRFPLKDCLRLRATCRSCRKTISNVIENKHCCHLPELPLAFLKSKNSLFFYSLSTKSVLPLRTPLWKNTDKCVGSVEGWLIVSDYSEKGFAKIFFLNPVTVVRIMIPSKLYLPSNSSVPGNRISYVKTMMASSKPNCDGSDCYLVGLLSDFCHIVIYKLFDKSWTIVEPEKDSGTYFTDVEIIGTKLYASDPSSYSILVYDLKDSTNGPPKAEVLVGLPKRRPSELSIILNPGLMFLAKDEALRELYFIYMYCGNMEHETQHAVSDRFKITLAFANPPRVTGFEVFKLVTNKDHIEWQNVKLEDRMVFVSKYKSMIISRDELNCNKELIKANSVYFALTCHCPTNPWSGLEFGMFCFTDSSIKYFSVDTLKHGDVPYPLWFVPSLW